MTCTSSTSIESHHLKLSRPSAARTLAHVAVPISSVQCERGEHPRDYKALECWTARDTARCMQGGRVNMDEDAISN